MIRTETKKTRLLDLVRKVGPLDVVYDCGSRDGSDGLELAIAIGATELHIFECNPPSVELCRKNVVQHKPDDLTVFINDCALSDRPGAVSFFPIDVHQTLTPMRMVIRVHPAFFMPILNTRTKSTFKVVSS